MIVAIGETQVKVVMEVCQRVSECGGMPGEWKTNVIVPIFRAGVPNQECSHPLGVRGSILGGARWSFRFLCCIFVLSCSVHHVLIVLHNQCLITACLMRGLQFSPNNANLQKKRSTHAISA